MAIARALNIDDDAAVGTALRTWKWAQTRTVDGRVNHCTEATIDHVARRPGFAQAMVNVDWLVLGDGFVTFLEWDKYNSRGAKERALDQSRKRRNRDVSGSCPEANRTETGGQPVPQKRKEEKRKERTPQTPLAGGTPGDVAPTPEIPSELRTDEFVAAWDRWQKHRREIRKPLTPTSSQTQLREMAKWGVRRAVAAIDHTIGKGWQGLREPDATASPSFGNRPQPQSAPLGRWT